jgi:hypothetical protein
VNTRMPSEEGELQVINHLCKAQRELSRLIEQLVNHPETVNYGMDYIYEVESSLRRAQKEWDREAFS